MKNETNTPKKLTTLQKFCGTALLVGTSLLGGCCNNHSCGHPQQIVMPQPVYQQPYVQTHQPVIVRRQVVMVPTQNYNYARPYNNYGYTTPNCHTTRRPNYNQRYYNQPYYR